MVIRDFFDRFDALLPVSHTTNLINAFNSIVQMNTKRRSSRTIFFHFEFMRTRKIQVAKTTPYVFHFADFFFFLFKISYFLTRLDFHTRLCAKYPSRLAKRTRRHTRFNEE